MKKTLLELLIKYNYSVIGKISEDSFGRMHAKIVNDENKYFFIKATSINKSYTYKSMVKESQVMKYIAQVTDENVIKIENYSLVVPKVERIIIEDGYICIISKFIEGDRLLDQTDEFQAQILKIVIKLIDKLNKKVKVTNIKKSLLLYDKKHIFLKIILRTIKAILRNPRFITKILQVAAISTNIIFLKTKNSLVHSDINSSNIICVNKVIYLTDWEESGFGIEELNIISPITVHWDIQVIRNALLKSVARKKQLITTLMAYRVLVLLNQKINRDDYRHARDMKLLEIVSKRGNQYGY